MATEVMYLNELIAPATVAGVLDELYVSRGHKHAEDKKGD